MFDDATKDTEPENAPEDVVADPQPDAPGDETTETADAKAKAKEASRPKRQRRGSAETTTASEPDPTPDVPRGRDGKVAVRASAKYVRSAPRKARLVMDHIRGKSIGDARSTLKHTPRAVATDISKLLESAIANAENNFELDPDDLHIGRATVDEGPTIKRYRPRAQGRATRIDKRTSHMTITLTTKDGN